MQILYILVSQPAFEFQCLLHITRNKIQSIPFTHVVLASSNSFFGGGNCNLDKLPVRPCNGQRDGTKCLNSLKRVLLPVLSGNLAKVKRRIEYQMIPFSTKVTPQVLTVRWTV